MKIQTTLGSMAALLVLVGLVFISLPAQAQAGVAIGSPYRIVVLPYLVEGGTDIRQLGVNPREHYRRIQRYINNQLVRHGFEVINPFAQEYIESQYQHDMQRTREDTALAIRDLTRKYGVDMVYLVWLRVTQSKAEGARGPLCVIRARVEGEGYDSAARDLGAGWEDTITVKREHCDQAIVDGERIVADRVARTLTSWAGAANTTQTPSRETRTDTGETIIVGDTVGGTTGDTNRAGHAAEWDCNAPVSGQGGAIQRAGERLSQLVSVRFDGADSHEQVEIFGKVLNTARGVYHAKVYRVNLAPDNPQASQTLWRADIRCTDTFRLAANISKMLREIVEAGGRIVRNEVLYQYTVAEVDLLKGVRMGTVSSQEIQFILDRKAAQRKELQGISEPGSIPPPPITVPATRPASDAGFD